MPLQPGDRVGDWVVVHPLGKGGMGSVYLAHSVLSDDVRCALKVIELHGDGDFKKRFVNEMRTLAALKHPGIVRVLGGGEDPSRDLAYMAMELVEGSDLHTVLQQGPLPLPRVRAIFSVLADALRHAHGRGVHHRDLKPPNLMIKRDGAPVLVDFGIAVAEGHTRLTQQGMVPGTAAYMAPEVFRGQDPDLVLADAYAFGVLLWEALTGNTAFATSTEISAGQQIFQVAGMKLAAEPLDPGPDVPASLRDLVGGLTEPDPKRRVRDLAQVGVALAAARPPTPAEPEGTEFVPVVRTPLEPVEPAPTFELPDGTFPPTGPRQVSERASNTGVWIAGGVLALTGVLLVGSALAVAAAALWFVPGRDPAVQLDEIAVGPLAATPPRGLSPRLPDRDLASLIGEGEQATRGGQWGSAYAAYGQALDLEPGNLEANLGYGRALVELGQVSAGNPFLCLALDLPGVPGLLDDLHGRFPSVTCFPPEPEPSRPEPRPGVLDALLNAPPSAFGTSPDADMLGGVGGLIGAKGTQIGSGGLGVRGSGIGGGGTAEEPGGTGTTGSGTGASGLGSGSGTGGATLTRGGDPIIFGALDRSLIDEVIKRHLNQIRYCYQRELTKNPGLSGKLVLKFVIAKDGTVSSANTKSSTLPSPAVGTCVEGRFMRMQFPKPKGGGIVIVSYPFVFAPG